ncbi:TIGR04222 domain-containing membrane protein [Streptomyces sp. NPDC092296]|uniref:TIGR04222 domain-containing membrane protein n=1 Tax=Streptomyces sp. NPDC092296 TaxID=3366012 RepID=UPI0037FFEE00
MWLIILLAACSVTVLSCLHLIRIVAAAGTLAGQNAPAPGARPGIGLYETAYLAGGPERVVDLAMVLMAGEHRLHPAHTGWTTVVDPQGRNEVERALIAAIGPEGQCRTDELRQALVRDEAVRGIGGRLALAGLATRSSVRGAAVAAIRRVRRALLLTGALAGVCLAFGRHAAGHAPVVLAWFSLPLVLGAGTLLMARMDAGQYTRWATPAGQQVLRTVRVPQRRGEPGDRPAAEQLTAVAVSGPAAVRDPLLRAALRAPRR